MTKNSMIPMMLLVPLAFACGGTSTPATEAAALNFADEDPTASDPSLSSIEDEETSSDVADEAIEEAEEADSDSEFERFSKSGRERFQNMRDRNGGRFRHPARIKRLKRLADTNCDGTRSPEEVQALADALISRHDIVVANYDADASGALEDAELDALKSDVRARLVAMRADFIAEFDLNGDNKVRGPEERAGVKNEVEARILARVAEVDTNDDGILSREERVAACQARREERLARLADGPVNL